MAAKENPSTNDVGNMETHESPRSESCAPEGDNGVRLLHSLTKPAADTDAAADEVPPLEPYTLGDVEVAPYYAPWAAYNHWMSQITRAGGTDLQKGECGWNADYGLQSSLGLHQLVLTYDIACQYRNVGRTDGEGLENAWARDADTRGYGDDFDARLF
ncbi:hypothetical protein B0H11DRAFT_2237969 [Mycena galericulata]|nr:hypothetical protein B0H11DRAFT_2237969 [Mycena galericulata]